MLRQKLSMQALSHSSLSRICSLNLELSILMEPIEFRLIITTVSPTLGSRKREILYIQ